MTDDWSLVTGHWSLVAGCWLLAAGCWSLVAGCWSLVTGCWLLVAGCWLLVAEDIRHLKAFEPVVNLIIGSAYNMIWGIKLIAMTAVLILGVVSPMAIGKYVEVPSAESDYLEDPTFGAEKEGSLVLAQNDKSTSEDIENTTSGTETNESKTADAAEDESSKAESKPLKPFVPSEKIPGEQAVDFPVDI